MIENTICLSGEAIESPKLRENR